MFYFLKEKESIFGENNLFKPCRSILKPEMKNPNPFLALREMNKQPCDHEVVIIFSLSFINRYGVRVSVIGCKSNLPISLQKCIASTEEITKDNKGLHLVIALNYGGYYDIIQATKSIASKVMNGFFTSRGHQ